MWPESLIYHSLRADFTNTNWSTTKLVLQVLSKALKAMNGTIKKDFAHKKVFNQFYDHLISRTRVPTSNLQIHTNKIAKHFPSIFEQVSKNHTFFTVLHCSSHRPSTYISHKPLYKQLFCTQKCYENYELNLICQKEWYSL